MKKDLADEIKELNKRISELEKMLSVLIKPLQDVRKTTSNYMRLTGLLLDHGADPNGLKGCKKNLKGHSPLSSTAECGDISIAQLLLEHGASPNTQNGQGPPPLCYAAERGDISLVRLLLESGASPNGEDDTGKVWIEPFWYAAKYGSTEILEVLLDAGADIYRYEEHKNSTEKSLYESALSIAVSEGHVSTVRFLLSINTRRGRVGRGGMGQTVRVDAF